MKKSSPHLERVPRLVRRPAEQNKTWGVGAIAALLVVGGSLLAVGGLYARQERTQEAQHLRDAQRTQVAADVQARADRTTQDVRETRLALLTALSDPQAVSAHPETVVAALERLEASTSGNDDANFRNRLELALSAARAHLDTPVTTAMEVRARPRN